MGNSTETTIIVGNLGKDPVVRHFDDGKPTVEFSVGVTRKWRDRTSGEMKSATEWYNVVRRNVGDKFLAFIKEVWKKGDAVFVKGHHKTRSWVNDAGETHFRRELVAAEMKRLGSAAGNYASTLIIGYLGADPEVRYSGDGDAYIEFSVGVTRAWRDRNTNEECSETEWHRVKRRKAAPAFVSYVQDAWKKGSLVFAEGHCKTRSWESRGKTHYKTELMASDMFVMKSGESAGGKGPIHHPASKPPEGNPFADEIAF